MPLELFKTPLAADANLRAYYRLEDDGTDSSGNGLTMSPSGSPTYVAGYFGNGVRFPLNTSYLDVANNMGCTGGVLSISAWLKQETEISSGSVNFVQQNSLTNTIGNSISYEYNGGTRRLYFRRTKWNVAHEGPVYNITLGTGTWFHIVYTYDGTNVRGYVNGALVAGPTAASGNGTGVNSDITTIVSSTSGATVFDDVAFFNRVLTAAEITSIYQGGGWAASTNYLTNYRPRKRTSGAVSV